MKTDNNKYVAAESNGEANAESNSIGSDEIWEVTFIGSDQVQLKGPHGKWLIANGGRQCCSGKADANRPDAWETFTIECMGNGKFAFKSAHGKYLSAESDGSLSQQDVASNGQTFEVVPVQCK